MKPTLVGRLKDLLRALERELQEKELRQVTQQHRDKVCLWQCERLWHEEASIGWAQLFTNYPPLYECESILSKVSEYLCLGINVMVVILVNSKLT